MRTPLLLSCLALGACAAPISPDALVLIDSEAREAGVHVVSEGRVLTGPLPLAVPGGLPLEVVTADGIRTLDPIADEVVDLRGPDAEVIWRRIGDDVDPDALWVGGDEAALEDLAWELDADLTWEDDDARLEGPQVLLDAADLVAAPEIAWSQASGWSGREAVWRRDAEVVGADTPGSAASVAGDAHESPASTADSVSEWLREQVGAATRPARARGEEAKPVVPAEWLSETPNGTGWVDVEVGTGRALIEPAGIRVHYTMWVDDDGVQDSSRRRGRPADFPWRRGALIQGWEEGLMGMREGGRRILVVPPDAGYGDRGRPNIIGPESILTFEVELLAIDLRTL